MKKKSAIFLTISIMLCSCLLCGCKLPGLATSTKNNGIVIAGGNTTERQILSEILKQMIEHYIPEAETSLVNNLGSSFLIHQAFIRGDVNVAGAMYTGTSLMGELGLPAETNPSIAFAKVVNGYHTRFHRIWFPSYGFKNTYVFMVTRNFATKNKVAAISDLKNIPSLKLWVDSSWLERDGDGYKAFKEIYGFEFAQTYPMEIGLVYNAIREGEMDIVLGYSTDGRINSYDLVLLKDDMHLFPPYDASPVATIDIIKKFPLLKYVFLKLNGVITNEKMQYLNKLADEKLIEPNTVAKKFLIENNYFEDKKILLPKKEDVNAIHSQYK